MKKPAFWKLARITSVSPEKTRITVLDDDNDGSFNSLAKDVIHVAGMQGGTYLGKYLPVKGKIYEIQMDPSGTKLRYRPWSPPDGAELGKIDGFTGYRAKGKPSIVTVIACGPGGT